MTTIHVGSGGNASVGVMNAGSDIDIEIFGTSLMLNGALTAGNDVDINALFGDDQGAAGGGDHRALRVPGRAALRRGERFG